MLQEHKGSYIIHLLHGFLVHVHVPALSLETGNQLSCPATAVKMMGN